MATLGLYFLGNTIICSGEIKPRGVPRFAVILAVVLMNHGEAYSLVVQRPSDTTAIVNTSTYFNCSTSMKHVHERSITWFHFPLDGGGQRHDVFDDGRIMTNYKDRFAIEKNLSAGTFNLLALRLEPGDAGRYECTDDILESQNASAELTVLCSDLVCESDMDPGGIIGPTQCDRTIAPDEVQLSCKMSYSGKIAPKMVWRKAGDPSNSNNTDCVIKDNSVTCNTTLTANLQLNEAVYICESTTQRYNCSLEMNKILYVFNGNARVNATIDQEVNCSANSSQSCSYKWKWFNGSDSVTVSTNQILKPTRVGLHRCEATCPIGNTPCVVNVMFVEVYSTQSLEATSLLWILVAVVVLIIVAVIVGIVVLYLRRKRAHERFSASKKSETILTEQSLAPLIAVVDEDSKQVKQRDAEQIRDKLKEKYISNPVLIHSIKTKVAEETNKWIKGLAILDNELFIISKLSSDIEVYDAIKLSFSRRMNLKELIEPVDITSCNISKCLYILNVKGYPKSDEILRVDSDAKLIKNWSTGIFYGYTVSITDESNVIVSVGYALKEYTRDGQLLITEILENNYSIRHALKLSNGDLLFSCCSGNKEHRVCIGNAYGRLKRSFGGKCGPTSEQMDSPVYLSVDENGFVLVADLFNRRVLLLDSNLTFQREILSKEKHGLQRPSKIIFDESNGRMAVADDSQILIFQIKE